MQNVTIEQKLKEMNNHIDKSLFPEFNRFLITFSVSYYLLLKAMGQYVKQFLE